MSDHDNPKDRKGVQDLYQAESTNDIARLADTMKILATEIQSMKLANTMKSSDVAHIGIHRQICGSPSHYADSCPPRGQYNVRAQEQNNTPYQPKPQYNNQLQRQGQQSQNSGGYSHQQQQPKQQEAGGLSNMESMMGNFLAEQDRRAQEQDWRIKELEQTIRMIGNQVAQQVDSVTREHGKLPSKPEHNPRELVNAITLRGGKQLEMIPAQTTRNSVEKSVLNSTPAEEETSKEAEDRVENSEQTVEPAHYKPPIPFPQRLKGARRDKEFMKFVDKIHTLYITMPFTDAIT
ncbi:unnamed protein product [Rhodiola kirilowii]